MLVLLRIALRNVIRNRRRSLLTLVAVFLATGLMVASRGVLNGLQASIKEGVVNAQTGAVQIHKKGFLTTLQTTPLELDIPADEEFLARIRAVPGVTAAAARIPFGGMINVGDNTLFSLLFAFDPVAEPRVCPQRFDIVDAGRPLDARTPDGVALSAELLRRFGARQGDKVTLISGDRDGVLNAADVTVTGVLGRSALPTPDQKVAYLTLSQAQSLLRMEGRCTEIAVATARIAEADEVAVRLRAVLGPEYEVVTWHDVAAFVDDVVALQDIVITVIGYILLIVALIGIANTILLNVLERTREIGTMVSLGLRRRQLLALFLLEAALLGLLGCLAGASAGGLFVWHFGSGAGIPIQIPGTGRPLLVHTFVTAPYLAAVLGVVLLGTQLSALYPAWWASRLRPVQALSHA